MWTIQLKEKTLHIERRLGSSLENTCWNDIRLELPLLLTLVSWPIIILNRAAWALKIWGCTRTRPAFMDPDIFGSRVLVWHCLFVRSLGSWLGSVVVCPKLFFLLDE